MKISYVILFTFIVSTFSIAQWERTNGPEGISIYSLAEINNVLYAGTRTDGLYASTDEGSTWYALNNGIETKTITAITSINDTLLIGTYDSGVYHSTDGGQTWLQSSNYNYNISVLSMVVQDQYIFAGTSQGLLRSSDGGVTWEDISFFASSSISAICSTGDKLIATNFDNTIASTDNGENWYVISVGSEIFSLYARGDTVFAGSRARIFRSVDAGETFIEIDIPFNSSLVNVNSITYVGQTLFMGTTYANGVYKSTTNGAIWESASEGMGPKDVRALAVTQSSYIIAGTHYAGVYRSTNTGSDWNKALTGFPAGSSILTMFNSSQGGIFAGTRDGLYLTTDNGTSWEKLTGENDTINYGEVRGIAARGREIYAAITYQFNGIVYKSTDFGETWIRSGNGFASDIHFMSGMAVSGDNIIAGSDQGLYYSTDDGNTWILSNQTEGYFQEIAATTDYLFAQAEASGGVYRSANDGITWIPSLISPSISLTSITAQENSLYAGNFEGGAFYSDDNGNNWYFTTLPSHPRVYTMKFIPAVPGMVLAGTSDIPYIYASFNYSHIFSPYSGELGAHAVTEAFTSNDKYTFAGTDYNGVWRRFLPGITPVELTSFTAKVVKNNVRLIWQTASEKNNSGFEVQKKKIVDRNQKSEWIKTGFVKGHGTSTESNSYSFIDKNIESGQYKYRLKQIDYDGSFKYSNVVEVNLLSPTEFSLEQNYPNPFNPTTTIGFGIQNKANVKITVLNSIGEEVAVILNEEKEGGYHQVEFNAAALPSGVYFYQLRAGDFTQTKKMILLR